jgi:pre-rRNA-processing protein IPI1
MLQRAGVANVQNTYLALHALLLSTFMEAAPSAFPPSSASTSTSVDDVSLNLCSVCVELVWVFARTFLNAEAFNSLATATELRNSFSEFLKRMTAWFPFNKPTQAASDAAGVMFGLSLNYAKLAATLAPQAPPILLPRHRNGWRYRVRAIDAAWGGMKTSKSKSKAATNEVAFRLAAEWIEDCLAPATDALAPAISATAYADLLPVIHTLATRPGDILEALLPAVLRQPSSSGKRRASDAFLVALLWTHEDRFSTLPFFVPTSSAARAGVSAWIASTPRTLWELAARDPAASETLLRFLLDLGTRAASFERPFSLVDSAAFPAVAGKLAPFFHLTHPAKGAIEGPWAKLPVGVQRLALDVARIWTPLEPRLGAAVGAAVRGTWAQAYWTRG